MGDAADWLTEQGFNTLAMHQRGECEGPCEYCDEEDKMSLSASYAYCSDGKFYKEPVWRGDNFFLCFDDDDPPELVIKKPKHLTLEQAETIAKAILIGLGIECTIDRKSFFGGAYRQFGKTLEKAFRYFLRISVPPPPPNEYQGTPTSDPGKVDGTIYHFGAAVPGLRISNPTRG